MKTIIFRISMMFITLALIGTNVRGQEQIKGTKQKMEIKLDELGNASVSVTMKLNASQWDAFKRSLGNNTSNLKRQVEKSMPKFFLKDFKYNEDQMERTYTLEMKALAVASIDKNGKWKAELDSKDPDISKVNEHQFKLDANYAVNGNLMEQTQQIYLPASAKNGKVEKDSFGKAVLTYQTGEGFMNKIITGIGVILILAGGALIFLKKRIAGVNKV